MWYEVMEQTLLDIWMVGWSFKRGGHWESKKPHSYINLFFFSYSCSYSLWNESNQTPLGNSNMQTLAHICSSIAYKLWIRCICHCQPSLSIWACTASVFFSVSHIPVLYKNYLPFESPVVQGDVNSPGGLVSGSHNTAGIAAFSL